MQVMGGFDNETNNQLSMLMAASAGNALQTFGGMNFSGADGLSSNLGAFMRSPQSGTSSGESYSYSGDGNADSRLAQFMSAAPQGSNLVQGFAATGMVPNFQMAPSATAAAFEPPVGVYSTMGMVPQSAVQIERAGDINVMRG
jgi:hypothetical protein